MRLSWTCNKNTDRVHSKSHNHHWILAQRWVVPLRKERKTLMEWGRYVLFPHFIPTTALVPLSVPLLRGGTRISERLRNLPTVTQLKYGRAKIHSQVCLSAAQGSSCYPRWRAVLERMDLFSPPVFSLSFFPIHSKKWLVLVFLSEVFCANIF